MKVSNQIIHVLSGVLIAILIMVILSQHKDASKNNGLYYVSRSDGSLFPLSPLSQPTMSDKDVISWTRIAVQSTLMFDYKNYRERLSMAKQRYGNDGWYSFTVWLNGRNRLERAVRSSSSVYTSIKEKPKIISQEAKQGRYLYNIEVPVEITSISGSGAVTVEGIVIELTVARITRVSDLHGLGIIDWKEKLEFLNP